VTLSCVVPGIALFNATLPHTVRANLCHPTELQPAKPRLRCEEAKEYFRDIEQHEMGFWKSDNGCFAKGR
jgi:hypothetical protein